MQGRLDRSVPRLNEAGLLSLPDVYGPSRGCSALMSIGSGPSVWKVKERGRGYCPGKGLSQTRRPRKLASRPWLMPPHDRGEQALQDPNCGPDGGMTLNPGIPFPINVEER